MRKEKLRTSENLYNFAGKYTELKARKDLLWRQNSQYNIINPCTHPSFLIGNKNSYRYGSLVGRYPWYFAIGCIIFSGFCGIGLINFTEENNAFRLWIPQDSSFAKNYGWLQENFPPDSRPVPDWMLLWSRSISDDLSNRNY